MSGPKLDRLELTKMIEQLRGDDTVVVTRLDWLAGSTRDFLDIAEKLKEAGAGLRSLAEPWAGTTSPAGRLVLTVCAGVDEFERELIHQRTSSGRVAAKERGVRLGRPPKLAPDQIKLGEQLLSEGTTVREAAQVPPCHALPGADSCGIDSVMLTTPQPDAPEGEVDVFSVFHPE